MRRGGAGTEPQHLGGKKTTVSPLQAAHKEGRKDRQGERGKDRIGLRWRCPDCASRIAVGKRLRGMEEAKGAPPTNRRGRRRTKASHTYVGAAEAYGKEPTVQTTDVKKGGGWGGK